MYRDNRGRFTTRAKYEHGVKWSLRYMIGYALALWAAGAIIHVCVMTALDIMSR